MPLVSQWSGLPPLHWETSLAIDSPTLEEEETVVVVKMLVVAPPIPTLWLVFRMDSPTSYPLPPPLKPLQVTQSQSKSHWVRHWLYWNICVLSFSPLFYLSPSSRWSECGGEVHNSHLHLPLWECGQWISEQLGGGVERDWQRDWELQWQSTWHLLHHWPVGLYHPLHHQSHCY